MSREAAPAGGWHQSVLVPEVLEWLGPLSGKTYIDGTVGLGGHASKILERCGPEGRLVGFDRDEEALAEARRALAAYGERVVLIQDDFKNIPRYLARKKVHGILLDLGVSSLQLEKAERGFSFLRPGPLDMRMDRRGPLTAREIVNRFPAQGLLDILWNFGQERFARRIVRRIVEARSRKALETTTELAALVERAVPAARRQSIHPATRTFQALRIAVNGEMESLGSFLGELPALLEEGGRAAVISFHSLEDRAVKHAFRRFAQEKVGRVLTRKPVTPSAAEERANPRSRSAKLRVFEKTDAEGGDP